MTDDLVKRQQDDLLKASRDTQGYKDALAQVWTDTVDYRGEDEDEDDELALPDRYHERSGETLAYRLMEYLEFLGVITKDHVSYLRYPPIELIEDAERDLKG